MSIFILEDDIVQAQNVKKLIEEICLEHAIDYDFIEVTSKKERILEKVPLTTHIPIYFLDIELKKEERKGLQVAQEIRQFDQLGVIVFVTTHSEFAPISYQYMVSALTFIDKGLDYDSRYKLFEQSLLHYQMRNQQTTPTDDFIIDDANATIRLPFATIEYIMTAEPHRLALVTENRVIHFYGTLKEIEEVDERLIRCHQSYLVNREKIVLYDASEKMLVLKSGKKIAVSRRLARKVKQLVKG